MELKKIQKILIIEDHPGMIEGYKSMLSLQFNRSFEFETVLSCSEAAHFLQNKGSQIDLILLDIALPPCEKLQLQSGVDLIPLIKKYHNNTPVLVLTSFGEYFFLYDLIKKHHPHGILIKTDCTSGVLAEAIHAIEQQHIYYSVTCLQAIDTMKEVASQLDDIDRSIIHHLSNGILSKNLSQYIPLTINAIDKRKQKIKWFFGLDKASDEDILREAKRRHFI